MTSVARRLPSTRALTLAGAAAAGLAAVLGATACSDPSTSGASFCTALREELPALTGKVRTQADIDALVAGYADLDERTPLAIQESWHQLSLLVATAATVVPGDPASVQAAADAAYATERSAREVATWVETTCGFPMPAMDGIEGPVTTAPPPHSTVPRTPAPTEAPSVPPSATEQPPPATGG